MDHRRVGYTAPRARAVSAIPRRSRWSSPSDSSSSTPTAATSCSIRSWARAPPPSPPSAPHRHFVGFDTDVDYVDRRRARRGRSRARTSGPAVRPPTSPIVSGGTSHRRTTRFPAPTTTARSASRPAPFARVAWPRSWPATSSTTPASQKIAVDKRKVASGVEVNFVAKDRAGQQLVLRRVRRVQPRQRRAGLRRTDTLWKALGQGSRAARVGTRCRTGSSCSRTDLPPSSSAGGAALRGRVRGRQGRVRRGRRCSPPDDLRRLAHYAEHGPDGLPPGT